MKLILRQYFAGLRERGELDAILPDLLSELGFTVLKRPGIGTRQAGVDVAAIGPDEEDGGRRKLFLFTIKPGDLNRRNWDDGSPQAVRQSLNEILDSYIRNRIPDQYQELDIAICICMGGEIKEDVLEQWAGYSEAKKTENICFREWNGDKLAGLLLSGMLKAELLKRPFQTYFEKSIAMVDHPDVAYRFSTLLTHGLLENAGSGRERLTKLRQVYICLWILYVWAREAGNLEAPFRASEYALLHIWNDCRSRLEETNVEQAQSFAVLQVAIELHLSIADELLIKKLGAYAKKPFAISWAVNSSSSVDVNIALFEQLGRLSLNGIWRHWQACRQTVEENTKVHLDQRDRALRKAIAMINANPALLSPIRDDFAIEMALLMILAQACNATSAVSPYLDGIAKRVNFSIKRRGGYPIPMTDYHDLISPPEDQSKEQFESRTRASVLYPLLFAWIDRLDLQETRKLLASCIKEHLPHTTQQVWVPDDSTDEKFWTGDRDHGAPVTGLRICEDPVRYAERLERTIRDHGAFNELSTTKIEFWPMFLMACRHYRMPVPPQLWFLKAKSQGSAEEADNNEKYA